MGLTAFSLLLPLSLLWLMRPLWLLQLTMVAAVFEAAAALTFGRLGVQPGLIPAMAFLCYVGLQLLLGARYPGAARVWRLTLPFVLVVLWALASSYLMPRILEGQVYVWPQKETPPFVLTALAPNPSNLNQDIYLALNTTLLVLAALFLTRSRLPLRSIMHAYFLSGFAAAGIAVWQLGGKLAGLPYPESLFYSNPGWAILTEQRIGAVPRINGSFSEPAALGGYMAACVCACGWLMLRGHRDGVIRALFVVSLLAVMLSTSTTGFAALAVAAALALGLALVSGTRRLMTNALRIGLPLLLLLGVLFVTAAALAPSLLVNVETVLTATVNKPETSSYQDRTSADVDSLKATLDSYGLGAGWGSNRSSSLLPGLLAGLGVPGVAGLLWFGVALTGQVRRARASGCSPDQMLVIDGCCGALVGFLIGAGISAPTITSVTFFLLLALLIGCVARVEVDARARARGRGHHMAARPALGVPGAGVAAGVGLGARRAAPVSTGRAGLA